MRWWIGILAGGLALVIAGVVWRVGSGEPQAQPSTPASVSPPAKPSPSVSPSPVLQKPGDLPASGPETFVYGSISGPVLGNSGVVKRFRVAVESNVAGELTEFGATLEQVLGDPRSWTAGGQHRFQRVAEGEPYDFTAYLVTRDTAYKMCKVNGVDIRQNGVPYTSCRQWKKVIINLDRWRLSVPDYVNGGTPLQTYREYVINHETGHELGRGHEQCLGPGKPAPVMQTQTLGLKGCTAYPWPYLDGRRYEGPWIR